MNYLVLRNCYTAEDRYFRKGDVVELPDEMFKAEKNFRPMDEPVVEQPPEPPERSHKHYYRKDGCCLCGAMLSANRMKARERKAKEREA